MAARFARFKSNLGEVAINPDNVAMCTGTSQETTIWLVTGKQEVVEEDFDNVLKKLDTLTP
jgi:uncharacterized protein YlzI (FlbEa/FlbD family)